MSPLTFGRKLIGAFLTLHRQLLVVIRHVHLQIGLRIPASLTNRTLEVA